MFVFWVSHAPTPWMVELDKLKQVPSGYVYLGYQSSNFIDLPIATKAVLFALGNSELDSPTFCLAIWQLCKCQVFWRPKNELSNKKIKWTSPFANHEWIHKTKRTSMNIVIKSDSRMWESSCFNNLPFKTKNNSFSLYWLYNSSKGLISWKKPGHATRSARR